MAKVTKTSVLLLMLMLSLYSVAQAAEIKISVDRTTLATDEIVKLSISIDGQIDGGQIGMAGLDKFEVVGQQSSQRMEVVNGETKSLQYKILSLKPRGEGTTIVMAQGTSNGTAIHSESITLEVTKSLRDATKDKLLKTVSVDAARAEAGQAPLEELIQLEMGQFPSVQHISAFNKIFWLEFLGILAGMIFLTSISLYVIKKFSPKTDK